MKIARQFSDAKTSDPALLSSSQKPLRRVASRPLVNVQWRTLGIGIYDGFAAISVGSEADPTTGRLPCLPQRDLAERFSHGATEQEKNNSKRGRIHDGRRTLALSESLSRWQWHRN
jgi:hypothetical protein